MKQTINSIIKAQRAAQDPKVVLMFLLEGDSEDDSNSLGWESSVLLGETAMMLEGDAEETLSKAEDGLRELLREGTLISQGMLIRLSHH